MLEEYKIKVQSLLKARNSCDLSGIYRSSERITLHGVRYAVKK
jgi:hypothetical protein